MLIAFAGGRFTGPSVEHQKLLDKLFATPADIHYVAVFGKEHAHQCTDRDPLTAAEKVDLLKKVYPDQASWFITGDQPRTKTPNQVLAYIYHHHASPFDPELDLTVVAGEGNEGVSGDEGGSLSEYEDIIRRLNHTKFPATGDYRMRWRTANFVGNPRGEVSGSAIRQFACTHNYQSKQDVKDFMKLLHTDMNHELARHVMKLISKRTSEWQKRTQNCSS